MSMLNTNLVNITKNQRYTSRSAVLSHFTCPYKRYLTYHVMQTGLVPEFESLDLIIGTCVHRGIQHLLEHCRLHHQDGNFDQQCVDEAVAKAYEIWNETLQTRQLALHSGEDERLAWIIAEQECLFEGLIRAFAFRRLPAILGEYTILEVEKEEVFENFTIKDCRLCQGNKKVTKDIREAYLFNKTGLEVRTIDFDIENLGFVVCPKCDGTGKIHPVIFLGKADGLFLRKSDNKIIQLSIKTASMYPEVTERNILHDMQGVSEQVCTNDRIERIWNHLHRGPEADFEDHWLRSFERMPKVYAVQYEFLLKGQRRQDPYNSGMYRQQSFLIHPYKQESLMTIGGGGVSVSPSEYKFTWGKGRPPKGWDKIDIWEDVGIKNWVEMLASGAVQPEEGNALDQLLITPNLILRTDEEIEEWKVSTGYREEEIVKHLDEIEKLQNDLACLIQQEADDPKMNYKTMKDSIIKLIQEKIWQYFPKNTQSCHNYYGRDCSYVKHCHEFSDLNQLVDAGIFIKRLPHHDLEKESMTEKGLINE